MTHGIMVLVIVLELPSGDWLKKFFRKATKKNSRSNDLSGCFNPSIAANIPSNIKNSVSVVNEKGTRNAPTTNKRHEKKAGLFTFFAEWISTLTIMKKNVN